MTTVTTEIPHDQITRGSIIWCWCSHCMERTDHLYTAHRNTAVGLICLSCNPESDPRKAPAESLPE